MKSIHPIKSSLVGPSVANFGFDLDWHFRKKLFEAVFHARLDDCPVLFRKLARTIEN
jgi:hypothetical protein